MTNESNRCITSNMLSRESICRIDRQSSQLYFNYGISETQCVEYNTNQIVPSNEVTMGSVGIKDEENSTILNVGVKIEKLDKDVYINEKNYDLPVVEDKDRNEITENMTNKVIPETDFNKDFSTNNLLDDYKSKIMDDILDSEGLQIKVEVHLCKVCLSESDLDICLQCRSESIAEYSHCNLQNTVNHKNESLNLICVDNSVKDRKLILQTKETQENLFTCKYCNCRFDSKRQLASHIDSKHADVKKFSCHICGYMCMKHSLLVLHMRTHTGEKPFMCDQCDFRCTTKSGITVHIRGVHMKYMRYSCNMCEYKCLEKRNLIEHKRTHTGEKPYACNYCDYSAAFRSSLLSHVKFNHKHKVMTFTCHICQYKCATKKLLNVHFLTHPGQENFEHKTQKLKNKKKFSCNLCQFQCSQEGTLVLHKRLHNEGQPFACDVCDFKCSTQSYLNTHINCKHKQEKMFSCHFCEFKSVTKNLLNAHVQRRHTEKSFTCNYCDYKCSQKTYLNNHVRRIHTKEKNFSCNVCTYKSVAKHDLMYHMRMHTGERPFACHLCDAKFTRRFHLKAHVKRIHK